MEIIITFVYLENGWLVKFYSWKIGVSQFTENVITETQGGQIVFYAHTKKNNNVSK